MARQTLYLVVGLAVLVAVPLLAVTLDVYEHGDFDLPRESLAAGTFLVFTLILLLWSFYGLYEPFAEKERAEARKGRLRSRWSILAVTSGTALGTLHFALGTCLWIYMIAVGMFDAAYAWAVAWPCFGLLALSLLGFVAALKRRRVAVPLLLVTLALAATAFWYDVSHERYQWRVIIATKQYLESHPGRPENYLTWWWY